MNPEQIKQIEDGESWLVTCRMRPLDGSPDVQGRWQIPDRHPDTGAPLASGTEAIHLIQFRHWERTRHRHPNHAFIEWNAEKGVALFETQPEAGE